MSVEIVPANRSPIQFIILFKVDTIHKPEHWIFE